MMKNKLLIGLFILSSHFTLYGKGITIKMATLAPEGSPWHGLLLEMGQEWKVVTDGKVKLRIYPGGVAGDERDVIRKIRIGQLHAAAATIEGLTEISKKMNVFYIPALVENFKDLSYIRNKLEPFLIPEIEDRGFQFLSWADVGWVYWFTKEPIVTPEDMKKLSLFVWSGDYYSLELYKKAGYHPVPLSAIDIMPSLQTGLIDAFSTTPLAALSFQWFALAPYMLDFKWGPLIGALIISNKKWDEIPKEYHAPMMEVVADFEKKIMGLIKQDEAAINVMKEHGLTVTRLSPEEKQEWLDVTKTFYPKIRGSYVPEEIFDKALEFKAELDSIKINTYPNR